MPLALLIDSAAQNTSTGMRESLRLLDLPEMWVLVLIVAPLLFAVCWLGYRGETLTTPVRATLATLRFIALALLFAVICRPVKVIKREEVQKAEVIVLVDDSASMTRKDAYAGDSRTAKALEKFATGALGDTTRGQLAQAALERAVLPKLKDGDYVEHLFTFAEELAPFAPGATLTGRGPATHLGDALGSALLSERGRHVTAAILISDGRENGGSPASEAARAAAAAGIPVHTLVIGDTRPEKNIVVELVDAPSDALEGDEIAITVRVLARGVDTSSRTSVRLEEFDPEAPQDQPRKTVAAEEEVRLTAVGERVTLVARAGPADRRTGDRRFHVEVPPLEDETLLDDNALDVNVHISPEKVRVLYVEGYPRWEYRRLALDMLKRADENIEFQAFLLSATPDFVQESTRGTPALRAVPIDRVSLLDHYDVVILGDVDPYAVSPDPGKGDEFMKSLLEFVERGGGLMFIAGEYDNPRAYLSTPLEALLPVVVDEAEMRSGPADTTREFKPRLEDWQHPHEIVRLHANLEINRQLWEDDDGLRGFDWFLPVNRAKPGSQVLWRHPREANQYGNNPLLVAGYYPSGRTLFQAVDSTWKWQYHFGPRYHERYWRNAIRWLALGRMKSGDRRYRLELARNSYDLGERVGVEARVLDEDYRPSSAQTQGVRVLGPDGRTTDLTLAGVPGKPGVFRASIDAERTGMYRVWIENGEKRIAATEFEVVLPSLENKDPSPNPALLAEVSAISRGKALDLARIDELWSAFPGHEERREPISSRLDDVWDTWGTLIAALCVLSLEWILRKRFELV